MKTFVQAFFASLLAVVVLIVVIAGAVIQKLDKKEKIKDHSYLVVDIYGDVLEYNLPGNGLASVMSGKPETLQRVLSNLEKVRVDDRIDGVIMKISASNSAGAAMIEEMRNAIKKVEASGKPVYAFTDNLDKKAVYLAAACDSIFLTPEGYVMFTGMLSTSMHAKNMLDKLGIRPNIHKIREYKSAAELVTRTDDSPEAKENREWLMDEMWDMTMDAVSKDRHLTVDKLVECMEHALFSPQEAKDAGLVDDLMYWPELEKRLMREGDEKLRTVSQERYAQVKPEKLGLKGKKKIAVVHAQGMIGGRESGVNPMLGVMMGHETVCAELRRALEDKDVAGVVFRIDSRGGESLASDIISHEVDIVGHEKPVVASMVDVAASGGYMIAYRATKMIADPTSITGSIGSISGKFNMKGFYDKLGITHDHITKGPMAMLFSDDQDFTPEERARFEQNHWDGFNAWLRDVAAHRGMTMEQAEKLAYGRVWTGRQAKGNGLIDELGGLDDAIALVKTLAEIPADEKVTVVHYPKEKSLLSTLFGGGNATAAVQWVAYRLFHNELVEGMNSPAYRTYYVMDEAAVE
jgi:protease-4